MVDNESIVPVWYKEEYMKMPEKKVGIEEIWFHEEYSKLERSSGSNDQEFDDCKSGAQNSKSIVGSITGDSVYVTVMSESRSKVSTDDENHQKLTSCNVSEFMEPYEKEDKEFVEWAKSKSFEELRAELAKAHNLEEEYRRVKEEVLNRIRGEFLVTPEKEGKKED